MHMSYVTLPEAAKILGKSLQTIRRMVKNKRIPSKKEETPQGFFYQVKLEDLNNFVNASTVLPNTHTDNNAGGQNLNPTIQIKNPGSQIKPRKHRTIRQDRSSNEFFEKEMERLNSIVQNLVEQARSDKENLFGVIKTFQERVSLLENHIKYLKAPKRKWWKLW